MTAIARSEPADLNDPDLRSRAVALRGESKRSRG